RLRPLSAPPKAVKAPPTRRLTLAGAPVIRACFLESRKASNRSSDEAFKTTDWRMGDVICILPVHTRSERNSGRCQHLPQRLPGRAKRYSTSFNVSQDGAATFPSAGKSVSRAAAHRKLPHG